MLHTGHTMATPDLALTDAIALFAELGMAATEVVAMTVAEQGTRHGEAVGDARIFSFEWDDAEVDDVTRLARDRGVPVTTITPYVKTINDADDARRGAAVELVSKYVEFARRLGASYVRVYGGADGFGTESWPHLVSSLRTLGAHAADRGVTLVVENHPGTLTVTGASTAKLVQEVASPAVRALYDPANVLYHSDEAWERTLDVQRDMIAYVHVKDYRVEDGKRVACPVGDGCVPWRDIFARLREYGYDGSLSYEYEKKWNREQLPDARTGLARSIAFVRDALG